MCDEGGYRRNYLFTMSLDGVWKSSSIPDRRHSCTATAKDMLPKNRKIACEEKELNRATWIWSGGWDSFETPAYENFTYVAVQGKETICVVTGDDLVVNKRKNRKWMDEVVTWIRDHNMFGYDEREMRRYVGDEGEDEDLRPFATVHVTLGAKEVGESHYEASSVGLCEKKAIGILKEKMDSDSAFTHEETIQTALSALQCLLCWGELDPNMIKGCVHSKSRGNWDERYMQKEEIKQHLNIINQNQSPIGFVSIQSKEEIEAGGKKEKWTSRTV